MYTDQETVEQYLQRGLSETESSLLPTLISAAEQTIENLTGKTFGTSDEPEERLYDGTGSRYIDIDDCVEVVSIEFLDWEGNSQQTLAETDYVLEPKNKPVKNTIYLKNVLPWKGVGSVRVTAKWGSSDEVPDNVKMIATMMVAQGVQNPSGLKSRSIEGYSETFGDTVTPAMQTLLDSIPTRVYI